ncbi:MAG: cytosine permease, partial [Acidobacteria bacterium]|nr:cytosine permease [Acidobacteriota bacterium]
MLPDYISKTKANPSSNRAPWYANTAPTYAGIFLWVAFYQQLAGTVIDRASIGVILLALVVAGLLSYALYYYAPAMLGMKTGLPLYVVGSSTFGTKGGYVMPGLLMGLLQIGWFAVGTYFATTFLLSALGLDPSPGTPLFAIIAIVWGYTMAWVGAKGIQQVSKVAIYLNGIAFLMVLVVFFRTMGGLGTYAVVPAKAAPFAAFTLLVQAIIGFFATAGAAGADFGMNNRNQKDVRLGGLVG